jgi:hypothetical protein
VGKLRRQYAYVDDADTLPSGVTGRGVRSIRSDPEES